MFNAKCVHRNRKLQFGLFSYPRKSLLWCKRTIRKDITTACATPGHGFVIKFNFGKENNVSCAFHSSIAIKKAYRRCPLKIKRIQGILGLKLTCQKVGTIFPLCFKLIKKIAKYAIKIGYFISIF